MRRRCAAATAAALVYAGFASACVTTAEFRKLEYEVNRMKGGAAPGGGGAQLADTAAELQALREQVASLEGRIEVVEHQAQEALESSRSSRGAGGAGGAGGSRSGGAEGEDHFAGSPEEVQAYRDARAAWRGRGPRGLH